MVSGKHVRSPFRYTGSQGSPRTWEMCVCVCLGWRKDEGCRAGHRGVENELGGEQSMAMWTSHPNFTLPEPNCEGGKWKDYFFLIIKVELIYNVVSISAVYQSDSVTHIPEYTYILSGKESTCYARTAGNTGLIPWWGIFPGGGHGNPLQYSCLENRHGQRNLADNSPWGCKESDMIEWLSIAQHTRSLSIYEFIKEPILTLLHFFPTYIYFLCY